MSTKTNLKRLALVVVSALGLGLMSWVAPANATLRKPTAISFSGTTGLRVGETKTITVNFSLPSGSTTDDTVAVLARVTSAPANSFSVGVAATPSDADGTTSTVASANTLDWQLTGSGSGNNSITVDTNNSASTSTNWTAAAVYTLSSSDSKTSLPLALKFNPDAAGSYTILVAVGDAASLSYDTQSELAGATTASLAANLVTSSVTVTTGGVADSITLTQVTSGAPSLGTAGGDIGALWKATVSSGGAATSVAAGETIVLSSTSSAVDFGNYAGTALTNDTLTSSDFVAGVAYFTVNSSADGTMTITAKGGGLLSSSVTATGTVTFTEPDSGASYLTTTTSTVTTNTGLAADGAASSSVRAYDARPGATSYTFYVNGTAADVEIVEVNDTYGKLTGKAGAKFEKVVTIGSTGVSSFTLTPAAALAAGDTFSVLLPDSSNTTASNVETANVEATASDPDSVTVANKTRRVAAASTVTFTATVKDQYGAVMANEVVTVSVSGRNPTTTSASYTTNSSGQVTHSLTDAGTASVNDTVTFTSSTDTSESDSGTIIYGTATATTVTVEGPNADDTLITLSDKIDISAGSTGAQAGATSVTATVEDASGNPMNGMAVVFTVTGTDCAITSTTQTVYTDSAGEATASVYKWTNGSCVVTATSGGASGNDTVHFAQKTALEARILSATVSGNVITATVKDRFGNVVPSVYVWASRTGGGFFANGASSTSAATAEDGTVQFVYTPDSATAGSITLQLGSATAADPEYGQSDASANLVASTTATDIFTATTTGTTTTAETGVGASLAPAGVNAVTVSVAAGKSEAATAAEAATDAALEAIDAANAATDAANLAAEAADAATVAAEEARDAADSATAAVEALASEVATLIAGLKAQITTLANTVAKIAKKVKA